MSSQRNAGSLVGGSLLIIFGVLGLAAGKLFQKLEFLGYLLAFFHYWSWHPVLRWHVRWRKVGFRAGHSRHDHHNHRPDALLPEHHQPLGKLVLWLDSYSDGRWPGHIHHGRLGTKCDPARCWPARVAHRACSCSSSSAPSSN